MTGSVGSEPNRVSARRWGRPDLEWSGRDSGFRCHPSQGAASEPARVEGRDKVVKGWPRTRGELSAGESGPGA